MKLIHVGQDEWMFEESIIEFPKNKSANDNESNLLKNKVKNFVDAEIKAGRDIDDIMNEVMSKFQDEIINCK